MRAIKILSVVTAGLLAIAILLGFFLPTTWQVKRAVLIQAPVASVHAIVNDLRRFSEWGGWSTETDPTVALSTSAPYAGVGAQHTWRGERARDGSVIITRSDPDTGIEFDVSLSADPPPGTADAHCIISYEPVVDGTKVTWSASGDVGHPPLGGFAVMLLLDTVGYHIQTALNALQALCEEEAPAQTSPRNSIK